MWCPLKGHTYFNKPATFKYVWPFNKHHALKGQDIYIATYYTITFWWIFIKDMLHLEFSVFLPILLTLPVPILDKEKTNLNFYFHTSLWRFKRFYEGLKGLHKTFCGTTKKCENKSLSKFLFYYSFLKCTRRERLN